MIREHCYKHDLAWFLNSFPHGKSTTTLGEPELWDSSCCRSLFPAALPTGDQDHHQPKSSTEITTRLKPQNEQLHPSKNEASGDQRGVYT